MQVKADSERLNDWAGLLHALVGAKQVALCAHVCPDGDTLGSSLALKLGLEKLGKEARVACQDPVPEQLAFLPAAEAVERPEALLVQWPTPDVTLCVDISDEARLGDCRSVFAAAGATAQVDHHGTNPGFAEANVVDAHASATGVLVWKLLKQLGVPIDTDMAKCLYAAVSTDTGNFSFHNTTADAFLMMGELMRLPLPLSEMNRRLFREHSLAQVLLLTRALSSLRLSEDGQIAGMSLSRHDFRACGALPEHADTLVNYALEVRGVQMAFLARETDAGSIKLSLRALPPCRVDGIAAALGGGGHALAAGCTLTLSLEESVRAIWDRMEQQLQGDSA